MKLTPYLYVSPKSTKDSTQAIIVLPEIYGLNKFVRSVADRVAEEFGCIGVGLDHFYAVAGQASDIDYDDHLTASSLAGQMTGEKYLELLSQAIKELQAKYPSIQKFTIIGFCFGGKLAYLSGVLPEVNRVVAFYGGGSLEPDFYHSWSAVMALAETRQGDSDLKVMGIYGNQDEFIPELDGATVQRALESAGINVTIKQYPAGHAFFNHDRDNRYVPAAAEAAWDDVKAFLVS